jgi:UDP:flavonoid glycosyltransferase YjiC (YdhE family)
MIVFSGGHTTCLETVKYVKPSVCIPTQSEQVGNARKMQDLNCSIVVKNSEQLKLAIEKMEEKKQFYKSNVKALNLYANKFNGPENTVAVIEDLVKT